MEKVEPVLPIRKILPVRKAIPGYLEYETQYQPRQKKQLVAKKSITKDSKPKPDKQHLDGVGDRVDYKV